MKIYICVAIVLLAINGCSDSQPIGSSKFVVAAPASSTVTRVCTIAAEQMEVDKSSVTAATTLADLGADELDFVELVMTLEEEFDKAISDAKIDRLSGGADLSAGLGRITLADLAKLVDD